MDFVLCVVTEVFRVVRVRVWVVESRQYAMVLYLNWSDVVGVIESMVELWSSDVRSVIDSLMRTVHGFVVDCLVWSVDGLVVHCLMMYR